MDSEKLLLEMFRDIEDLDLSIKGYEDQNKDYEAILVEINQTLYRCRRAKLTPKKKGYFVALWEKNKFNKNQAYNDQNMPGKLIITVIDGPQIGLFIIPRWTLIEKGILQTASQKGKMAFRIYPPWSKDLNDTASQTQTWQLDYFIDLSDVVDAKKIRQLI